MTKLILILALVAAMASLCQAEAFIDDSGTPPFEPFVPKKAELFRYSRAAKGNRIAKYEQQQQQQQQVENNEQLVKQQTSEVDSQGQQQVVASELPAFGAAPKITSEVAQVAEQQQQQQQQPPLVLTTNDGSSSSGAKGSTSSSSSSSSSTSSKKKSALSKTITTTTTTTTTTQNNQDQPQVAQIKEVHVHTVPLSQAVHYANYVVVPTAGQAARLEESSASSSSSSSHKSSSSSTSTEMEQVAPAPTVVVNPAPLATVPADCVLHRLVVERPVSSQLVVSAPAEVKVSHSSSSHSSRIVSSESAAPFVQPQPVVYVRRYLSAAPLVTSARVVATAPVANDAGHSKEEHFHSESRSSREESGGLGHVASSSSSSSSSRTSKSSTTTNSQQAAALVAPPAPIHTVTVVRQAAPLVAAIKTAPLVAASRSSENSVSVDHHQSGPNYNYGYSIKQQSSEPGTKGVVVGERVVYLRKFYESSSSSSSAPAPAHSEDSVPRPVSKSAR